MLNKSRLSHQSVKVIRSSNALPKNAKIYDNYQIIMTQALNDLCPDNNRQIPFFFLIAMHFYG